MKRIFTTLLFASTALAQTPAATDALDSLRAVRSATEVGINFRDYSTRVVDAKIKVDKYIADAPKDDAARPAIEGTMRLYILALKLWGAHIQKYAGPVEVGEEIMASPEFSTCADMPELIASAKSKRPWYDDPALEGSALRLTEKQKAKLRAQDRSTPAGNLASALGDHPATLWRCAAAKLETLKK